MTNMKEKKSRKKKIYTHIYKEPERRTQKRAGGKKIAPKALFINLTVRSTQDEAATEVEEKNKIVTFKRKSMVSADVELYIENCAACRIDIGIQNAFSFCVAGIRIYIYFLCTYIHYTI